MKAYSELESGPRWSSANVTKYQIINIYFYAVLGSCKKTGMLDFCFSNSSKAFFEGNLPIYTKTLNVYTVVPPYLRFHFALLLPMVNLDLKLLNRKFQK